MRSISADRRSKDSTKISIKIRASLNDVRDGKKRPHDNHFSVSQTQRPSSVKGQSHFPMQQLCLKMDDDKFDPQIAGLTELGGRRLVAADTNNRCLKIYWLDGTNQCKKIRLEGRPFGVSTLDAETIVATLPEVQRLAILTISPTGKLARRWTSITQRKAYGVCVLETDRIAVTSPWEKVIDILNTNCSVVSTFRPKGDNQKFFWPEYICVTPDETLIVTDAGSRIITCVRQNGQLVWTLDRERVYEPLGVCANDNGQLYVADSSENCVWEMPPGATIQAKMLTAREHGLRRPRALYWYADTLYVGDEGTVKIFNTRSSQNAN